MKLVAPNESSRIDLIDALRGSALFGILLLHSVEHWDFDRFPENSPAWLRGLDAATNDVGFFLFGGKAYGIFAMLFGVSFFLIIDRWSRRGLNFKSRFLWRLSLLAMFGYLNGIIFCGDVLLIIAVLGVPLVFLSRLGNRALGWTSVALLLQIPSLWHVGQVLFQQGHYSPPPRHWAIYDDLSKVYAGGTFRDVVRTNLWEGQLSRIWWTIETGRYSQMLGLFVWGLLLGRAHVFENPARSVPLAKRALLGGVIGLTIFCALRFYLRRGGFSGPMEHVSENLISAYRNLAQLVIWVSGFVLLYQWAKARTLLQVFAPYGRMSLTCYVMQGLIGVPVFYGFGLAMYRVMGPFYSILFGAALGVAQCMSAQFWLKRFNYGPLEWLWRVLTFLSFGTPLRKRSVPIRVAGHLSDRHGLSETLSVK